MKLVISHWSSLETVKTPLRSSRCEKDGRRYKVVHRRGTRTKELTPGITTSVSPGSRFGITYLSYLSLVTKFGDSRFNKGVVLDQVELIILFLSCTLTCVIKKPSLLFSFFFLSIRLFSYETLSVLSPNHGSL